MEIQEVKTVIKATQRTDNALYVIQYIFQEKKLEYVRTDVIVEPEESPLRIGSIEWQNNMINIQDFPLNEKTHIYISDFNDIVVENSSIVLKKVYGSFEKTETGVIINLNISNSDFSETRSLKGYANFKKEI